MQSLLTAPITMKISVTIPYQSHGLPGILHPIITNIEKQPTSIFIFYSIHLLYAAFIYTMVYNN